jgi:hypothetical protein
MARHFFYGLLLVLGLFLGFVFTKAQVPKEPQGDKAMLEVADQKVQPGREATCADGPAETIKRMNATSTDSKKEEATRYLSVVKTEPHGAPVPSDEMAGIFDDAVDTIQVNEEALEQRISYLSGLSPIVRQALQEKEFVSSLASAGVPAEDIEAMVDDFVETLEEPDKELGLLEIPPVPANHPNQKHK